MGQSGGAAMMLSQMHDAGACLPRDARPGPRPESHDDDHLIDRAASLLACVGIRGPFSLSRLDGGANNRVFQVDAAQGPVVLKDYFRCDLQQRDRLAAEYTFISFARDSGIDCVPRPLACDPSLGWPLYEFVAGRRLEPGDVDADAIEQAVELYRSLNRHRRSLAAGALPKAAEACYTISDHLACVENRIERLLRAEAIDGLEQEAASFVRTRLRAAWVRIARVARRDATRQGWPLDASIADDDRCLSPSDFGFHNALRDANGKLRFIDFEYAGWDDPAKLVCDFFCQPAVPVPREFFESFAESVAAGLADPEGHVRRFRLLLPVHQIKWCCILLNDFLPDGGRRREFALPSGQQAERRQRQLLKARAALSCVP